MSARSKHPRGFTLIEILATLMLLAIVLPVAMRGVQLALQSANKAKHLAEASSLAETKLNDLIVSGLWQQSSGSSGDFGADYPGYQWTFQSQPRDYSMNEIWLTVTWLEAGKPSSLTLATMAYATNTGVMP